MIKNGYVEINGVKTRYAAFGHGNKKLVVLPGLSDGLTTVKGKAWLLFAPYIRFFRDYTVYMFSRKDEMPEGYSIKDMADDQALALKALGIEKACLLGVSQGGMIAQTIAMDHPETVEKLILAVTAPCANDTVKEAVSSWISMAEKGDHRALTADTAERTYSDKRLKRYRRLVPLLAALTKPRDYGRFLINARAILGFDARGGLKDIKCPTLIIAGDGDRIVGTDAAGELRQAIAGSELYIYKGLGHGAYEEAKDFYSRVKAFCDR